MMKLKKVIKEVNQAENDMRDSARALEGLISKDRAIIEWIIEDNNYNLD